MKPDSQAARLLAWLRANPGSSSIEVTMALRIVNVTGRISDLRARGVVVECRSVEGVDRYFIREPRPVDRGEPIGMGL